MTTETAANIILSVRDLLDDASTSYTDSELVPYVADAFRELWRVRPASRYIDGVLTDQTLPSATTDTVTYDDRWRLGIVYFATARACETGVKDSVNLQLSQTMKQQALANFAS